MIALIHACCLPPKPHIFPAKDNSKKQEMFLTQAFAEGREVDIESDIDILSYEILRLNDESTVFNLMFKNMGTKLIYKI